MTQPLLEARGLKKVFSVSSGLFGRGKKVVHAVDGVDLTILRGETLGLVGESGCGKSTLGRTILRLHEPTAGEILYAGQSIKGLSRSEMRSMRRKMQIIFQDPYASLNPRMNVRDIIAEALEVHGLFTGAAQEGRIRELLKTVGLRPEMLDRFPHEFSGGQRQRIGIARALAVEPEFIVCDEPISALDVSIQAQVINLLQDLQEKLGLTYLFIAHDLTAVRHISDRVAVMYLGNVVEIADKNVLFDAPKHPYTKALLSAVPRPIPGRRQERIRLKGEIPSPIDPPSGCKFHPRCPDVLPRCKTDVPKLVQLGSGQSVSCHLYEAAID